MKNIAGLFLLLVLFCPSLHATNYYLSSSGNDAYTPQQAQDPATPWRSLGRVNDFMANLLPGDSVLFRRGDVFTGTLRVTASGSASKLLCFGAWGNGVDPVISGLATVSGWTSAGNNTWNATVPDAGARINTLLVDGVDQRIGRYPNTGYLAIGSAVGNTSITDNSLPAAPLWNGGEVVIRKNRWVLDRNTITNHDGHTISYQSESGYNAAPGYGYFIQNHPATLDLWGEWYYAAPTKKLGLCLPGGDPAGHLIQASVADTLVSVNGQQYLSFSHLSLVGSNRLAFCLRFTAYVVITDCIIDHSGEEAIHADGANDLLIDRCSVDHTNNIAVNGNNCAGLTLRNTTIRNTGTRAGMGRGDSGSYEAILLSGNSNTVQGNTIDSTGYIPITFSGSDINIAQNYIRHYAFIKDDGGAIYTWNHSANPPLNSNRRIEGNIILDGIGAPEGTDNAAWKPAHGIYIDDNADQVEIVNNTVAACAANGIFLHNAHDITLRRNTVFNNNCQFVAEHDHIAADAPLRGLRVASNIFFARTAAQGVAEYKTIANDLSLIGSFDSNYYCRPLQDRTSIYTAYNNGSYHGQPLDLDEWQSLYQQDLHSFTAPAAVSPYRLQSVTGANQYANGSFTSNIDGLYAWSAAGNCQASWTAAGLDGGSLRIAFGNVSGSGAQASVVIGAGALRAGRQYRLRFSLRGSEEHKKMEVFLRKSASPYNDLSERQLCRLRPTRTENEYLFTATATDADASIVFAIEEQTAPVYMDNLQLNEVSALVTNPDDSIRFAFNPTPQPASVVLDGSYIDVPRVLHTGGITLAPYSSTVLTRQNLTLLPTGFLSIQGARSGRSAVITWSVSTSEAPVRYEVERLTAGYFVSVGSVPPSGSSTYGYRFVDSLPAPGRNQYRVRQDSRDGASAYSRIVYVDMPVSTGSLSSPDDILLSPNPATGKVFISLPFIPNGSLTLRSITGATLRTIALTAATTTLDVSSLSRGIYLLCLASEGRTVCKELVKN